MEKNKTAPMHLLFYMSKWLLITAMIGAVMGALGTFFLKSLTWVTEVRVTHPWLLLGLPLSGATFAYLYQAFGKNAGRGNNLVIEQANGGQEEVPLRLIPLTLFGTITTHLFGGSVGREGTAVQMGGSVANAVARFFHLKEMEREIAIICGISAGFSAVFGTPLAGTIFGLEVLIVGRVRVEALFPSFFAAFFANVAAEQLSVTHAHYAIGAIPSVSAGLVVKLLFASACFGLASWLFTQGIVCLKQIYARWFTNAVLRNFVGGCVVVLAAVLLQTDRYLGLSLPLLEAAFAGTNHWFDWLGKLGFTVLSLGAGYQGGEVTPLFEIGATLGADLAQLLHLSVPFLAALGFIGVFAGATKTPLACFVMGMELFQGQALVCFFLVAVVSYLCSGERGIYASQQTTTERKQLFIPFYEGWFLPRKK